jgi:hypothetical protein
MQQDQLDLYEDSCAYAHPLPSPPPQAGEGADRVRRSLIPTRNLLRTTVVRYSGFSFAALTISRKRS